MADYLLHQRDTGPHVTVTVTRCELVEPRATTKATAHTYCYGDWTYRGRRFAYGYVQGAGPEDEGTGSTRRSTGRRRTAAISRRR